MMQKQPTTSRLLGGLLALAATVVVSSFAGAVGAQGGLGNDTAGLSGSSTQPSYLKPGDPQVG